MCRWVPKQGRRGRIDGVRRMISKNRKEGSGADVDRYLAEVATRLQVFVGHLRLVEWEDAIDGRNHVVDLDKAHELLQHRPASSGDSSEPFGGSDQRARFDEDAATAAHPPDHHDRPARADRFQGLRQCSFAADFNHEIDAGPTGEPENLILPFRALPVVHGRAGAKGTGPLELLILRRRDDRVEPGGSRELQCPQ